MNTRADRYSRERGSGLIVIIMIVAFMLAVGMLLLTVTGTSPKVADSLRLQGLAFDAAEAGFNQAWIVLNDAFLNKVYTSFSGHYHTSYDGMGGVLDDPAQLYPYYFRKLTDEQIVADCEINAGAYIDTVIFNSEPLATDPRCTYTVFLINDEAPGTVTADDHDCILVCIGRGPRNTYKRLEIVIEVGL
ncbi:MAG: pilus assembly PilX N-terminal domain-containing protein [Candidatus Aminicenantes bacterium]|nr:pilus assembly PilX N-terminal domain-containing protein [Candidatus Aminicenantes bacterium]